MRRVLNATKDVGDGCPRGCAASLNASLVRCSIGVVPFASDGKRREVRDAVGGLSGLCAVSAVPFVTPDHVG